MQSSCRLRPRGSVQISLAKAERKHLVDDLVVIDRGRLITTGSMREFKRAASLVRTGSARQLKELLDGAGATTEFEDDETLIVSGLPIEEIGERAFASGIVLHELSTHAGSLEDLFLAWTSGADGTTDADDAKSEVTHL